MTDSNKKRGTAQTKWIILLNKIKDVRNSNNMKNKWKILESKIEYIRNPTKFIDNYWAIIEFFINTSFYSNCFDTFHAVLQRFAI